MSGPPQGRSAAPQPRRRERGGAGASRQPPLAHRRGPGVVQVYREAAVAGRPGVLPGCDGAQPENPHSSCSFLGLHVPAPLAPEESAPGSALRADHAVTCSASMLKLKEQAGLVGRSNGSRSGPSLGREAYSLHLVRPVLGRCLGEIWLPSSQMTRKSWHGARHSSPPRDGRPPPEPSDHGVSWLMKGACPCRSQASASTQALHARADLQGCRKASAPVFTAFVRPPKR